MGKGEGRKGKEEEGTWQREISQRRVSQTPKLLILPPLLVSRLSLGLLPRVPLLPSLRSLGPFFSLGLPCRQGPPDVHGLYAGVVFEEGEDVVRDEALDFDQSDYWWSKEEKGGGRREEGEGRREKGGGRKEKGGGRREKREGRRERGKREGGERRGRGKGERGERRGQKRGRQRGNTHR
jgi:hypothetical protein